MAQKEIKNNIKTVGLIGVGIIGSGIAKNLLKSGFELVIYNRTKASADNLIKYGAIVVNSPSEVVTKAEVIITCLLDSKVVESIITDKDGILDVIRHGQIIIDSTTNFPPSSLKMASLIKKKGADMLDAPVSGGGVKAQNGTLSIMVGGDLNIFKRCLTVFNAIGEKITHVGPTVGDGGYAKLANQIMVAINLTAMGEAFSFAKQIGLNQQKLFAALSGVLANSEVLRVKIDRLLKNDFPPGGKVDIQIKDLDYVARLMKNYGFSLPITKLVHELFKELSAKGYGNEDHSAIIRIFDHNKT